MLNNKPKRRRRFIILAKKFPTITTILVEDP